MMSCTDKVVQQLQRFCEDTDYTIIQENGARIFLRREQEIAPPDGCEVFVGRLPHRMLEDKIVPLFWQAGRINELRLMVDYQGFNRGFCFVRYYTLADAETAIRLLHGYRINGNVTLVVYKSVNNRRIFIGDVPTDKTAAQIREAFEHYVDDIKDVIVYEGRRNGQLTANRGYAFLDFETHRQAACARRSLRSPMFQWGTQLRIDWADPIIHPSEEELASITVLHLNGIPVDIKQAYLRKLIREKFPLSYITRIFLLGNYGFVHFATREQAEEGMALLSRLMLGGRLLKITWARPRNYDRRNSEQMKPLHHCTSIPYRARQVFKAMNTEVAATDEQASSVSHSPDIFTNVGYFKL